MRLSPFSTLRSVLWLTWAAGVAITAALAWQGADVNAGGLPGCGGDGDCSGVLSSSYSRLLGISLTTFALVYYAAAGVVLVMSQWLGHRTIGAALSLLLPVLSSAAVTTGLWAAAIMLFVLRATCPWCLAVHVANAAFFILAIVHARTHWKSAQRQQAQRDLPTLPARIPVAVVLAAVLLCIWQVGMLLQFADDGRLRVVRTVAYGPNAELIEFDRNPIELLGLRDDAAILTFKGRVSAPDRLVMFSCYTCPKCQEMNRWLKKIIAKHPDRLRVDFRMAPLSPLCNPSITPKPETSKHRVACAAARAAVAVARVDGDAFAGFSDWLYFHRETMSVDQIMAEGRRSVGAEPFDRAIKSAEVATRLKADLALVQMFQVSSVPRIYIRPGQIRGSPADGSLERLLEAQLGWPDSPAEPPPR